VVLGIVTADQLWLPSWVPLLTAASAILAGLYGVYRGRSAGGAILLCAGLGLVAAFNYSLNHVDMGPHHVENVARESRRCRIFGRVADWPDIRQDRTEIKLAVDSLQTDVTRPVQGAILLKISDTTTALQRGDRVEFVGRIYPLPRSAAAGSFDYGRFLNLKGVQGIVYLNTLLNVRVDRRPQVGLISFVDDLRQEISDSLRRNLSRVAAALAGGFLIGETRDIPVGVYEMFRDSGTLHLLAVSGSNVALVLAFFLAVLRPFQLRPLNRSLLLLAVIVLFAGLSYAEPSVVRASLMASLVILARLLRRTYDLNNIIALTALIILLVEPAQLFDVGFQLSFVTAWGLILLVPKICAPLKPYHGRWWYRAGVFPLIVAVVAQVCSTPVVAYYFGRIPVISIFANLLIVVMVSVGVVGILTMLALDLVWPLLGQLAGSFLDIWLNLIITALVWMGGEGIPVIHIGPLLDGPAGPLWVILIYIVIVLAGVAISHKSARRVIPILLLIIFNLALVSAAISRSKPDVLVVEFTTVPGGLAATVTNPLTDETDLVITGLRQKPYPVDERILLPWLERQGIGKINRIFVLAADYAAIDDILRLATATHSVRLVTTAELRPSIRDHLSAASEGDPAYDINFLQGRNSVFNIPGYSRQYGGLLLQTPAARLLFVDRFEFGDIRPSELVGDFFVAIGHKWTGGANDWSRLHRLGYTGIICSEIEQVSAVAYYDPGLEPDNTPPDYYYDLSSDGDFVLELSISPQ